MIDRIKEHLEFHEAIDTHKSDTAFFRELLRWAQQLELENEQLRADKIRLHESCEKMATELKNLRQTNGGFADKAAQARQSAGYWKERYELMKYRFDATKAAHEHT